MWLVEENTNHGVRRTHAKTEKQRRGGLFGKTNNGGRKHQRRRVDFCGISAEAEIGKNFDINTLN